MSDVRALIVQLMRGRFVTPVIARLGEQGVLDHLAAGPVRVADLPALNPDVLRALLEYLEAVGLVAPCGEASWQATAIGTKVFKRWGAFGIVDSYDAYFARLDELLEACH